MTAACCCGRRYWLTWRGIFASCPLRAKSWKWFEIVCCWFWLQRCKKWHMIHSGRIKGLVWRFTAASNTSSFSPGRRIDVVTQPSWRDPITAGSWGGWRCGSTCGCLLINARAKATSICVVIRTRVLQDFPPTRNLRACIHPKWGKKTKNKSKYKPVHFKSCEKQRAVVTSHQGRSIHQVFSCTRLQRTTCWGQRQMFAFEA